MAVSPSLNSPLRVSCLGSRLVPGAPTSVGRKGLSRQRAAAAGRWGPWNRLRQRSSLTARQRHGPRSRRPCSRGRTRRRRATSTCWKEDTASAPSSRRQAPQQPRRLSALPRRAAISRWISPRTRTRGSRKSSRRRPCSRACPWPCARTARTSSGQTGRIPRSAA